MCHDCALEYFVFVVQNFVADRISVVHVEELKLRGKFLSVRLLLNFLRGKVGGVRKILLKSWKLYRRI